MPTRLLDRVPAWVELPILLALIAGGYTAATAVMEARRAATTARNAWKDLTRP